jgi:Tfp pilus assembly protein FimT
MKKTLIPRSRIRSNRTQERGITMLLVALAMVAIIGMAALSIDVITLYLAREEAQHSADSAALGAAKVLALSGITGDPTNVSGNWGHICGPDNGTNGLATRVAKAIATQNTVGEQFPPPSTSPIRPEAHRAVLERPLALR